MRTAPIEPPVNRTPSPLCLFAASVLFVSAILGVLLHVGTHEQLVQLLRWVEDRGVWAAALFTLIMAAVVIFLLPGIFFTIGAGFVFGVVEGSVYVVTGTTLGAAAAFLIARYLLGNRAARFIRARSWLHAVDEEMTRHDWKIVMMTRLIPFFPSKIANYFFGLTSFSFRGYVLGSFMGFIPFSVHNVYLGAMAASFAALGKRDLELTPVEWTLYAAGFLATVIAVLYLNRVARRALDRYTHEGKANGGRL